jgi:hypothetical protein
MVKVCNNLQHDWYMYVANFDKHFINVLVLLNFLETLKVCVCFCVKEIFRGGIDVFSK